jgi:hypothetical protein
MHGFQSEKPYIEDAPSFNLSSTFPGLEELSEDTVQQAASLSRSV